MITPVVMPQLGLEVTEGTVTEVHVEVGAEVRREQPLLELATDKLNTDVLAPCDGHLRSLAVAVGDTVAVGALLALVADTLEEPLGDAPPAGAVAQPAGAVAQPAGAVAQSAGAATSAPGAGDAPPPRLRAAPVARRAALDLGVDLAQVRGSGPRGRITLADVRAVAAANADAPPAVASTSSPANADAPPAVTSRNPPAPAAAAPAAAACLAPGPELTPLRRAIARRMTESQRIPQYELARDVDASHLLAQKRAQAASVRDGAGVGITDLLVQAVAEMVSRHPGLAVVFHDDADEPRLSRRTEADVGLAVATDRGLLVPVMRGAAHVGLGELAAQRTRLTGAAHAGRLTLDEMAGAAITVSNLGGFGIDRFTAMLNPGEAAIVAVGRTVERLVPRGRGIAVVPTLTVTMSFDHRVVDGAVGAAALATLAELLEGGMAWRP